MDSPGAEQIRRESLEPETCAPALVQSRPMHASPQPRTNAESPGTRLRPSPAMNWEWPRRNDDWHSRDWSSPKGKGKGKGDGKGWAAPYGHAPQPCQPPQRTISCALEQLRTAVLEQRQLAALMQAFGGPADPVAGALGAPPHVGLLPPPSAPPAHAPPQIFESPPAGPAPPQQAGAMTATTGGAQPTQDVGLLAKIRTLIVGAGADRPAKPERREGREPTPASHQQEDEVADLLRGMTRELEALRRENARLRRDRETRSRRASAAPRSRSTRRQSLSCSRSRSTSPRGPSPTGARAEVRAAIAAAISRDAQGAGRRSGASASRAHAAEPDDVSDFSIEENVVMMTPDEHSRFFQALGARSTLRDAIPLDKWTSVACQKWARDDWAAKARKVGVSKAPPAKADIVLAALQAWRASQPAEDADATRQEA